MLKNIIKTMTWKDWALVAMSLNLILAVVNLLAGNYTTCIINSSTATLLSATLNA